MGAYAGPEIVNDGLVLHLDAANEQSYPGSGTTWFDLSGNGNHFAIDTTGISYTTDNKGCFILANGGAYRQETITTSPTATCVFWMKTTDAQSLFLSGDTSDSGGYYLGAYRSGKKEYYDDCGSPQFYMDSVDTPNIYDYIRDGTWHMLEFKNIDFQTSPWPYFELNQYNNYSFGDGAIAALTIYNRVLTDFESEQNFNALRGRFGI